MSLNHPPVFLSLGIVALYFPILAVTGFVVGGFSRSLGGGIAGNVFAFSVPFTLLLLSYIGSVVPLFTPCFLVRVLIRLLVRSFVLSA